MRAQWKYLVLFVGAAGVSVGGASASMDTPQDPMSLGAALVADLSAPISDGGAEEFRLEVSPQLALETTAASLETAEAQEEEEAPEKKSEWDFKLTIAFGFSDGNTEAANFAGIFVATQENDYNRFIGDMGYFYSASDGETSTNRFTTGIRNDFKFNEAWFWFVDFRYDYDEFQSWDHRISGHTGPGWNIVREANTKLTLLAGAGFVKEFGSDDEDLHPEGMLGADFEWLITKSQTFKASTRYLPRIDEFSEFRWLNALSYDIKIDQADGLSVSVGFLHEYQSEIDPGFEHNDFKLFGGITFDF